MDPGKVIFSKEELTSARQLIEEHLKTEEKKDGGERRSLLSATGIFLFITILLLPFYFFLRSIYIYIYSICIFKIFLNLIFITR